MPKKIITLRPWFRFSTLFVHVFYAETSVHMTFQNNCIYMKTIRVATVGVSSVSCNLQPICHSEARGDWGQPVLERGSPYVPDGQVSAVQRKKFGSYTSEISIFITLSKEKIHIHIQTYIHVYIQSKDQLFKITILLKHPPLPNCTVM